MFLHRWINHAALHELEHAFDTMAGQVLSAADQLSWLCDATAAIGRALGVKGTLLERLTTLTERLARGLQADVLPVAKAAGMAAKRNELIALASAGLHTPEVIAAAPDAALEDYLEREAVARVKAFAARNTATPVQETKAIRPLAPLPVLVVDQAQPDRVLVDGRKVALQDKQFRLLEVLALSPGECVPYGSIYDAIWGDTVVEQNQLHFQKRKLIAALEAACPERKKLVKTLPKRGFRLELLPEQVIIRVQAIPRAA